jgi:hypothetical protein
MVAVGIGIGLQFPTALVAVQNAVPRRDIGVATATAAFSRSLGAALAVAVLTALLMAALQAAAPAFAASLSGAEMMKELVGGMLAQLDAAQRLQLTQAVRGAFERTLLISAAIAACSFVMAARLPDTVLQGKS